MFIFPLLSLTITQHGPIEAPCYLLYTTFQWTFTTRLVTNHHWPTLKLSSRHHIISILFGLEQFLKKPLINPCQTQYKLFASSFPLYISLPLSDLDPVMDNKRTKFCIRFNRKSMFYLWIRHNIIYIGTMYNGPDICKQDWLSFWVVRGCKVDQCIHEKNWDIWICRSGVWTRSMPIFVYTMYTICACNYSLWYDGNSPLAFRMKLCQNQFLLDKNHASASTDLIAFAHLNYWKFSVNLFIICSMISERIGKSIFCPPYRTIAFQTTEIQ